MRSFWDSGDVAAIIDEVRSLLENIKELNMWQNVKDFLDQYTPHLAFLALIVLMIVQANKWLVIPDQVFGLLEGSTGMAGVMGIRHSNAAAVRRAAKAPTNKPTA